MKTKQPILIRWQRKIQEKKHKHKRLWLTNIFVHHQATASTSLLRKKKNLWTKFTADIQLKDWTKQKENTHSYTFATHAKTHNTHTQIDHHQLKDLEFSCLFIGRRSSSDRDRYVESRHRRNSVNKRMAAGIEQDHLPRREHESVCLSVLS